MRDLKNKILILLIVILSSFLITILFIFNISIYNKEYSDVEDKIKMIGTFKNRFNTKNNFNPVFIENDIYEVVFNKNKKIEKINSYSSNGLTENEIVDLINKNLKKINRNEMSSLYTNDYIFKINHNGNLLIINNSNVKTYLINVLIKTIIIFIFLEIVIIFVSIKITKWLVKPIEDNFNRQKQFIYDASHELKTPIAIIGASVETLEKSPKEKKWLETIKSENERIGKLVTNLLELAKSENIKENEKFVNNNLSKIIENKALLFESLIFENKLELVTNIDRGIMFKCNEDRIKELLSILIDNAIKHSFKKSIISVNLKKEKKNIILSVTNQGEEIPISEREKIFERFYRIDKARNRKENRYGLGLSIAKNIVLSHNGNISVDCKNGYTIFKIIFREN